MGRKSPDDVAMADRSSPEDTAMTDSPPRAAAAARRPSPADVSMTDSPPRDAARARSSPDDASMPDAPTAQSSPERDPGAGGEPHAAQTGAAPAGDEAEPAAPGGGGGDAASSGGSGASSSSSDPDGSGAKARGAHSDSELTPRAGAGAGAAARSGMRESSHPPLTTPAVPAYPYHLRPRRGEARGGPRRPAWWSPNHELTAVRSATYAFLHNWAFLPAEERRQHLAAARAGLEYAIAGLARGYGRGFDAQVRAAAQGFHADGRRAPRMRLLAAFLKRGLAPVAYLHLAPVFRAATRELPAERLATLLRTLAEEDLVSVEYFCKLRRLAAFNGDAAADVLSLDPAFAADVRARRAPVADVRTGFLARAFAEPHPHALVVPAGVPGREWDPARDPVHSAAKHNLLFRDRCVYDATLWADAPDDQPWVEPVPFPPEPSPHLGGSWTVCAPCRQRGVRTFCMHAPLHTLVELRDYGAKGVGVRALAPLEVGDVLAEYTGLILPNHVAGERDTMYQCSVEIQDLELFTM